MKRRDFIRSSVLLTSAASVPLGVAEAAERPRVKHYRRLGRTDIEMSDISFGTGRLASASMVLRAVDRGINYFDTAPDYGESERYIGEAMQRLKQRDKVYLASKFCGDLPYEAGVSHLQVGSSKRDYKQAVESSLQRLRTDYLDLVFVHAMGERRDYEGERARLLDENMLLAADELRREGKIRYLAVSSHGPYQMERLMSEAVRSGHYDAIMVAFNFMKFPKLPEVFKEAAERGVGIIAMKTLAGARDMAVDANGGVFEHSAFKWVLQHPEVAGLVVTMKRARDIDLYLEASGVPFEAADQRILDRYLAAYGRDYCRTGCSDCEPSCPAQVPVATILRYQMYFEHYGEEKRAIASYAGLPRGAAACLDCVSQACASACPNGLPVGSKLLSAHRQLTFDGIA
jgi:aryl-alcohol dehydrogenase-like predicted oxidoreductase